MPRRKYHSPNRDARSEDTRAAILHAAGLLFGRQGFSGASMRDISNASGCGLSTIVYHFGSKEELFLETIRRFTLELGRLNQHFAPLLTMDALDPQAFSDALRDTLHSFLRACHGPDKVEGLLDLYLRVLTEGNEKALQMLLDCFADVQAALPPLLARIRPGIDAVQAAFWQQLLWSLLQYTVVSKRLVLYDMKLPEYTEEYLAEAAWQFAYYCALPLGLPAPRRA